MYKYKLYGMPGSLYTAKVRSYFRTQAIPFVERGAGHPDFGGKVIPAVGRFIIPVVEFENGEFVQDGADIIDFFEAGSEKRFSVIPESPLLAAVSYLFELFGGEGLLRPAMHYRWNFDEYNIEYLREDFPFALAAPGSSERDAIGVFDMASSRMREAAESFGVTEESAPLIEASYSEFMHLFSQHLKDYPFLLGNQPSVGDYGLIAPLFAHLSRDPYPALLMRQHSPGVARWVERMHASEIKEVGYADPMRAISAQAIPDTLKGLMNYVASEYLPEIVAHVQFANEWLDERPDLVGGTNGLKNPANRYIGMSQFSWRGISLKTAVMPYRFYLLQRLQDLFDGLAGQDRSEIETLFAETGLTPLLTVRTARRVERKKHLEVWGDLK